MDEKMNKVKQLFLIAAFLMALTKLNAQITEVKIQGGYAKIYNEKGYYSGNSIYIYGKSIEGYNNKYIVIKEGSYAKIYDSKGSYTGNSIYLGSYKHIENVSGSILVKEGSYIKYYDFKGSYTGYSTYDPK